MKQVFFALALAIALPASAQDFEHPAFNDKAYVQWSEKMVQKIINNSDWERIPIDSDKQLEEYITLEYQAYKKEITKEQFIQTMEERYPGGHSISIKWIASQFPE